MNSKILGWLSLITLVSVTLWLIIMIWDLATASPLEFFQQVLAHIQKGDWKFTLTYLNAGIFTVGATALMAGIYTFVKPILPEWSMVGFVFVPIYGTLNLFAYLSQITLVPALLQAASDPVMADTALLLLQQTLQLLPGSAVGFFNGLAYAILGIPSIIFGVALTKIDGRLIRISGWLLLLSGIASILGIFGNLLGSTILAQGTLLGGVIFWLALFPMTLGFFRSQNA